jgi:hypothetical protein
MRKVVVPGMGYLWSSISGPELKPEQLGQLGAFIIFFVIIAMWMLISAWMDMRTVLIAIGVRKFERDSHAVARNREFPLDLIWYLMIGIFFFGPLLYMPLGEHRTPPSELFMLIPQIVLVIIYFCCGLVALARRVWLSKNSS